MTMNAPRIDLHKDDGELACAPICQACGRRTSAFASTATC